MFCRVLTLTIQNYLSTNIIYMKQHENEGVAQQLLCPEHSFVLRPLHQGLYFKRVVELCLCPIKLQSGEKQLSIIPKYLNDRKDYTPAFILQIQEQEYMRNDMHNSNNLLERVKRHNDVSQQIKQVPRPLVGRKFCYICRLSYDDYLQHTTHKFHLHRLKTNRYRNMIAHLCRDHYPTHYIQKPKRFKQPRNSNSKQGIKSQDLIAQNSINKNNQELNIQVNKSLEKGETAEQTQIKKLQQFPNFGDEHSNPFL